MNHGNYDDDDDDEDLPLPGGFGRAGQGQGAPRGNPAFGQGGILSQLMGGMGGGGYGGGFGGGYNGMMANGMMGYGAPSRPSAFDDYFKAYSVAFLPGPERPTLAYGGKVIMPPSALAKLTNLDIASPWTFQLRNPKNPSELHTHGGVLEFIADEGCVYLPAWMMKRLRLDEGDPIRLTGSELPKGKLVKIQAQTPDFVEVSDPKAVLETALRSYSALTKNDIIEIEYNSIHFELLIMETVPEGSGISVIDTDLEVDFERPKGYVTPKRTFTPLPTMADKLKIDVNEQVSSGIPTRAGSVASSKAGTMAGSLGAESAFESFKGSGMAMNGRKSKGKGKKKEIEEVDPDSKIIRTDKSRIVTNESLANTERKVPAPLVLPFGKLFFGYTYKPYDPSKETKKVEPEDGAGAKPLPSFVGSGSSLAGQRASTQPAQSSPAPPPVKEEESKPDPWASLSGGSTLNKPKPVLAQRGVSAAQPIEIEDEEEQEEDYEYGAADSGSEFNGFDDDDDNDAIIIDSD